MKTRSFGIAALLAAGITGTALLAGAGAPSAPASAASASAEAATFKIDNVHSGVVFKVKHLGVSHSIGRFNKISGDFTWDGTKPDSATINVTIDAGSIDTNNSGRDGHLNGPDFFNTKEFPEIKFVSKSLTKSGDNWELAGDLTLLGKTNSVKAKFEFLGEKDGGARAGYVAGWDATFTIKRSDFGMNYGVDNGALGNDVQIGVAVEGRKQ